MGTFVEGEWDDLFRLVKKCHNAVMKKEERAITTISVDDRKGKPNRLEEKVKSVEKRLGRSLKKQATANLIQRIQSVAYTLPG